MKIDKTSKYRPTNRIFVKVVDKNKPRIDMGDGRTLIPTKWVEKAEVKLGSLRHPNKKILAIRIEPATYN